MLLYKGVLRGVEQGTSSRSVAADNPPQGSARFLFGSDKVPGKKHRCTSAAEFFQSVPGCAAEKKHARTSNCNPSECDSAGSRPPARSDLSWVLLLVFFLKV